MNNNYYQNIQIQGHTYRHVRQFLAEVQIVNQNNQPDVIWEDWRIDNIPTEEIETDFQVIACTAVYSSPKRINRLADIHGVMVWLDK